MARSGWLEPQTRIPFAGIVAMVLIVAVVAIFLKVQMGELFPDSTVEVRSAQEERNVAGLAASSYFGERKLALTDVSKLQGLLHTTQRQLAFLVHEDTLTIIQGSQREEVLLIQRSDRLTASFEYNTNAVRVDVFPKQETLVWSEEGSSPVRVSLSERITYESEFIADGTTYEFIFYPAGEYVTIQGPVLGYEISLLRKNGLYVGTWFENGNSHPVKVDPSVQTATIEEVW